MCLPTQSVAMQGDRELVLLSEQTSIIMSGNSVLRCWQRDHRPEAASLNVHHQSNDKQRACEIAPWEPIEEIIENGGRCEQ